MKQIKKANPKASPNISKHQNHNNTLSSHAQRARLIQWLEQKPITTLQARHELSVMHPAGRVLELRKMGYDILTHWFVDNDSAGRPHRVARYVLVSHGVAL